MLAQFGQDSLRSHDTGVVNETGTAGLVFHVAYMAKVRGREASAHYIVRDSAPRANVMVRNEGVGHPLRYTDVNGYEQFTDLPQEGRVEL